MALSLVLRVLGDKGLAIQHLKMISCAWNWMQHWSGKQNDCLRRMTVSMSVVPSGCGGCCPASAEYHSKCHQHRRRRRIQHSKYSFYWMNSHWKDWRWSWSSNTLATWCKELTHRKRPWCWKRLKAGGEGDDRGWDGWMASPTQWTWVWVNSGSWW